MQVILATAKTEAPPLFKLLAMNFRKRDLAFGWFSTALDADVAEQLPPPRVPHLMVAFIDPTAVADAEGRVPMHVEPYDLPFKHLYMKNFIQAIAARLGRGDDQVCSRARLQGWSQSATCLLLAALCAKLTGSAVCASGLCIRAGRRR